MAVQEKLTNDQEVLTDDQENLTNDQEGVQKTTARFDPAGKKTARGERTRMRIMDAAARTIAERGNTAIQMSEISSLCNISKGAVYYYFSDKDDLVNSVLEAAADDLVCSLDEIVDKGTEPAQTLRDIAAEISERTECGSPLAIALVRELVRSREGEMLVEETSIRHIINAVTNLLERAKENGGIRADIDCRLAAVAVCGAFTFCAISANDDEGTHRRFEADLVNIIGRGLRNSA